ncbi:MAG: CNNM domain-containing protein, partial [Ruthenibacterium lactatiformans]
MDTVLPSLFLQVILIASNAFFAMSEFAVVSVNTQKMKRLAEGGSKPAARLLVITEAPSDFLATIQ